MEPPKVKSVLRDEPRKITYEVMAYRTLTEREMSEQVAQLHGQKKFKKKRGRTYTFITKIGFDEQ